MKTLDKLLKKIYPEKNLEKVAARVDEAINSFRVQSCIITQWEDYKELLTKFYNHVENIILQIGPSRKPHPDIDWGRSCRLLMQAYGQNGEKAAFEMVRTGKEGGLYAVLKTISQKMANEYSQNEIRARVYHYWNNLSTNEKLEACDEYINKYGHLLPDEMKEGNAARVRVNFTKVLEEHPHMIERFKNIR
jgi:hypothetical protein